MSARRGHVIETEAKILTSSRGRGQKIEAKTKIWSLDISGYP